MTAQFAAPLQGLQQRKAKASARLQPASAHSQMRIHMGAAFGAAQVRNARKAELQTQRRAEKAAREAAHSEKEQALVLAPHAGAWARLQSYCKEVAIVNSSPVGGLPHVLHRMQAPTHPDRVVTDMQAAQQRRSTRTSCGHCVDSCHAAHIVGAHVSACWARVAILPLTHSCRVV